MGKPAERTDRFLAMLQWFEDQGGPVMMRQEHIADACGLPISTFLRYMHRAKDLGLIRVEHGGSKGWGVGGRPNRYRLVVKPEDWLERRDATVKRERRWRDDEARARRHKRQKAREQLEQLQEIEQTLAALEGPDPILARVEAQVLGEAEIDDPLVVDAWLAGDF